MRIIAGTAKGRTLRAFSGDRIRPTSDRVREAVFSMLFSRLGGWRGKAVLDLCAGTGAMAIEALSRGAARAVLMDGDRRALGVATENLVACGLDHQATLVPGNLPEALGKLPPGERYEVIFLDPPYHQQLADRILAAVAAGDFVPADGLVCVETGIKDPLQETYGNLALVMERRYGRTRISLFSRAAASG